MDFRLPALGEGIDMATVTAVLVKTGDAVKAGQAVLSVETDKAAMDVEADTEGTVEQVLVKAGDKVPIGTPVLKLTGGGGKKSEPATKAAPTAKTDAPKAEPAKNAEPAAPAAGGEKIEFRLPALGEGIETATVTAVLVKPGERIKPGQAVLSVGDRQGRNRRGS